MDPAYERIKRLHTLRDLRKAEEIQRWHLQGEQFRKDQAEAAAELSKGLPAPPDRKLLPRASR